MKRKVILGSLIQRNGSELTPWQSQNLSPTNNGNSDSLQTIEENFVSTRRFLPRVTKLHDRSSPKLQKMSYQLPRKEIIPDQKTFETIKSAKQTAFNGFMTKYKSDIKNKNKRYLKMSPQLLFSPDLQMYNTVKVINFNSLNQEEQRQNYQNQHNYITKQAQFCKKRSLSNLIKSVGKDKYLKLKEPCRHSPWMLTSRLSLQPKLTSQSNNSLPKVSRNVKLLQLNLGIRQRNLPHSKGLNK